MFPKPTKVCKRCEAPVLMRKARGFCSAACWYAWRREKSAVLKVCVVCKKEYRRTPTNTLKTCSAACGYEYRKSHSRVKRLCAGCGVEFSMPQSMAARKFCSRSCWLKTANQRPQMLRLICPSCGHSFKRTSAAVARVKNSFCSHACAMIHNSGERNAQWRGGSDPNRGREWAVLAEDVRCRDSYRCQRCSRTESEIGERLSVDHLIPWRAFGDKAKANCQSNLVSLCRKCHAWKTQGPERRWLRGDVIALRVLVRSLVEAADSPLAIYRDVLKERFGW